LTIKNEILEKNNEISDFKSRLESQETSNNLIISNLENKVLEYQRISDQSNSKLKSEEFKLKAS